MRFFRCCFAEVDTVFSCSLRAIAMRAFQEFSQMGSVKGSSPLQALPHFLAGGQPVYGEGGCPGCLTWLRGTKWKDTEFSSHVFQYSAIFWGFCVIGLSFCVLRVLAIIANK